MALQDVPEVGEIQTLAGHTGWVMDVQWSADNAVIASSSWDCTVRLWTVDRVDTPGYTPTVLSGHSLGVWSSAFSPTQPVLASCGIDRSVRLWHVPTGQALHVLQSRHLRTILSARFSPCGHYLASAGACVRALLPTTAARPLPPDHCCNVNWPTTC